MDKEKALKLLQDTDKVLDELNLTHFITDGTLLGAVRGGDFIDHDTDLDMGVFTEEFTDRKISKLILKMDNRDIKLHHGFGEFPDYFEIAFKRDGIKIDIFFYKTSGNKYIFHAFQNGGKNLPEDVITYEYPQGFIKNPQCDLPKVSIQGNEFTAPNKPHSFLRYKYGEDWQTPKKQWDWKFDPNNVVYE